MCNDKFLNKFQAARCTYNSMKRDRTTYIGYVRFVIPLERFRQFLLIEKEDLNALISEHTGRLVQTRCAIST